MADCHNQFVEIASVEFEDVHFILFGNGGSAVNTGAGSLTKIIKLSLFVLNLSRSSSIGMSVAVLIVCVGGTWTVAESWLARLN